MSVTDKQPGTSVQLDSRNGGWDTDSLAQAAIAHIKWQREQYAADERIQRVLHAARWGRNCGECGRELLADEKIHRRNYTRKAVSLFREVYTDVFAVAPTCVACAETTGGHHSVGWGPQIVVGCAGCHRPMVTGRDSVRRHPVCSIECLYRFRKDERARWAVKPKRLCETCGTAYRPKRADARYCSPACRQKAYRRRVADVTQP